MKPQMLVFGALLMLRVSAAQAQDTEAEETGTVGELASEEEVAQAVESIGRIGCTAPEVENEGDDLFEVDDAECEIGQYDIKLDGEFNVVSMTRDE